MGKDLRYNSMALLLCAIACIGWSYVLDLKYYRLEYTSWDLPLYANLMWNLCHGSVSTSLFGRNFLSDHFNAIAFVLVPFYYFFQSALTMLYFKLFAFFAGAYIFYLLAAKRLGGFWGIALMLAYMFYPANVTMIFFEFNFENMALPMIFLLFYFFEEKKFLSFMASCFLLAIVKENMPLIVFMFGIYAFMTRKEDRLRWGLCPLLLGGGMFIGEVFIFIPWVRHGLEIANEHLGMYSKLGSTPLEIARTFVFKEPEVFKSLFNSRNVLFLAQLFGPLLITALWSPLILLIASPLFLQNLLSQFPGQQSIDYYYASTLTVFIFMATIDFLGRINIKSKAYLLTGLIGLLFIFDLCFMPQWCRRIYPSQEKQEVSQYFISQIPPDAGVMSSYKFLYMLSQRKDLYVLFLRPDKIITRKEIVPDNVDYMIADFAPWWGQHKDYIEKILSQGYWKVQAAADEVVLLKKNAAGGEVLIRSGDVPLSLTKPLQPPILVSHALKIEGLDVPTSLKFGQRIMRIVFYWEALKHDMNMNLPPIYLNIYQGGRMVYFKDRASIYGLPMEKGKHYKGVYYYLIPRLSPGDYKIYIYSVSSVSPELKDAQPNICIKNISVK